jgi:hypothetical protein
MSANYFVGRVPSSLCGLDADKDFVGNDGLTCGAECSVPKRVVCATPDPSMPPTPSVTRSPTAAPSLSPSSSDVSRYYNDDDGTMPY